MPLLLFVDASSALEVQNYDLGVNYSSHFSILIMPTVYAMFYNHQLVHVFSWLVI